ncbi:MAG: heparan-alpha-glucosaminide N-acetyltransferase [Candidatus Aenigmatarchaeota archaeon]
MERLQFLDSVRGILVILMIFFNYSFTLSYLDLFSLFPGNFIFWFLFPRFIASSFIFLSGITAFLSWKKYRKKFWKKCVKRFLKFFLIAFLITIITYIYSNKDFVIFGIIHFFAFSSLLLPILIFLKKWNIFSGFTFLIIGLIFNNFDYNNYFLVPFGIKPKNFSSMDYIPLFPWLSFLSFGIFFATILEKRIIKIKIKNTVLSIIGKNSFLIYLLHQPILFLILSFV